MRCTHFIRIKMSIEMRAHVIGRPVHTVASLSPALCVCVCVNVLHMSFGLPSSPIGRWVQLCTTLEWQTDYICIRIIWLRNCVCALVQESGCSQAIHILFTCFVCVCARMPCCVCSGLMSNPYSDYEIFGIT